MGQRSVRVNELVLRELSAILHTRFQKETVHITLSAVDISPDLRQGRIYYSVIGDALQIRKADSFFGKYKDLIRKELSKKVVLKYLPKLTFVYDPGMAHGSHINNLLDELEA